MKITEKKINNNFIAALLLSGLMMSATNVFAQEIKTETTPSEVIWKSYWATGYKVESSDKQFKMVFGGRIMNDWVAVLSQDASLTTLYGEAINGTEFRRVRLFNSGTIYNNVKYKVQFDFAGKGIGVFKDVYIQITKLPIIGNFKVGHFKESFGLEELTSSKYITFMERSLTSPFIPVRNTGFMVFNHAMDEKLTWAFGVFRDADSYGEADDYRAARFNITSRITALPLYDKENNRLLHLGLAYTMRNPDNKEYNLSSQPESHMQPKYVNASMSGVDGVRNLGTELALVMGPFSFQSEFISSSVKRTTQDESGGDISVTNKFSGYYAMASFFLTKGDNRVYKSTAGAFSRVKPKKNFGDEGGMGALEVAIRYSRLDLVNGKTGDNTLIAGGTLNDITVGINWYLNPATRVMLNYVAATVKNADISDDDKIIDIGKAGFVQMRFQIDF